MRSRRSSTTWCARFGRIDALVNNAGINPARIKPEDMTLDYWRKVFSVNLEGPLRTSQCVFPIMRDQGGGSIVHIGTMAAYSGGGAVCAYGASKAALLNLTKSQASEWAQYGIRVNFLSPGPVHERDDGRRRAHRTGFHELVTARHVHEAHRRPAEIVGPVLLPRERRVVVRHRRRPLRLGRDVQVARRRYAASRGTRSATWQMYSTPSSSIAWLHGRIRPGLHHAVGVGEAARRARGCAHVLERRLARDVARPHHAGVDARGFHVLLEDALAAHPTRAGS